MIIILSINNVPDDETNSTRRIPENISVSLSVQIIQHREEKSSFSRLSLGGGKRKGKKTAWIEKTIAWITNGSCGKLPAC